LANGPSSEPAANKASATLSVEQQGDLVIGHGSGFKAGAYDVRFTRPDGSVHPTQARADDKGELTTYGRIYGPGKHRLAVQTADGKELAGADLEV
jgi:hypothetical protein